MAIADRCLETTFSLTGEEEAENIEEVEVIKYLGKLLDQWDDNFPAVLRNIWKAQQVWRRIGKLLRTEEAEPVTSEKFYCVVVHAVMLFGEETWVLLLTMAQRIEGVNLCFL